MRGHGHPVPVLTTRLNAILHAANEVEWHQACDLERGHEGRTSHLARGLDAVAEPIGGGGPVAAILGAARVVLGLVALPVGESSKTVLRSRELARLPVTAGHRGVLDDGVHVSHT